MQWFNNLKIRLKFLLVGVFVLSFVLAVGGIGIWASSELNRVLQITQRNHWSSLYDLTVALEDSYAVQIDVFKSAFEDDPAKLQALIDHSAKEEGVVLTRWNNYKQLPRSNDEQKIVTEFDKEWTIWLTDVDKFYATAKINTSEAHQQVLSMLPAIQSRNNVVVHQLEALATSNYNEATALNTQTESIFWSAIFFIILITVAALGLTVLIGILLARSINSPLTKLRYATQALATGDLTQLIALNNRDELGDLSHTFNSTLVSLRQLVFQLSTQSQQVSTATEELTSQANQQVVGSSQQASAITEATQSLAALNQTANEIAQSVLKTATAMEKSLIQAHEVNRLAKKMEVSQSEGLTTVLRTLTTLQELSGQMTAIEQQQKNLQRQSETVQNITSMIDNIAKETHLLALNAAIEAAGAGEYGERFMVVAAEVKLLANRSMQATKEVRAELAGIAEIVQQLSYQTTQSLLGAEQAVQGVDSSEAIFLELVDLSTQVKRAAYTIVEYVETTTNLTNGIGAVTQQQLVASNQMLETMLEIKAITSQNLSSVRQGENATLQLNLAAHELKQSAAAFKLVAA